MREHNDRLRIVERRISHERSKGAVADAGKNIIAHINICVVKEDNAQRAHLLVERRHLLIADPHLVVARNVIDGRDLYCTFDEVF